MKPPIEAIEAMHHSDEYGGDRPDEHFVDFKILFEGEQRWRYLQIQTDERNQKVITVKISGTEIDRTDEITYKWAAALLHASEPGFYDCSKPKELVLTETEPEVCFKLTPKSQKQFDANFCFTFWPSQQCFVQTSSLSDSSASSLLF